MKRGQSWMWVGTTFLTSCICIAVFRRLEGLEDSNIPCSHQSKKKFRILKSIWVIHPLSSTFRTDHPSYPVRNHAMHLSSISTGWTLRCFLWAPTMCIVCWVGQVQLLDQSSNRCSDGNVHLEESISKTWHYWPLPTLETNPRHVWRHSYKTDERSSPRCCIYQSSRRVNEQSTSLRWSDGNVHLEESISKGTTGHYPPWKRIQDMFDDTATRPMNEARLVVAFIKAVDK